MNTFSRCSSNTCNNCGKNGHVFYNCKIPITSFGVIAYSQVCDQKKFIMIKRKNTYGYIDFIRGRYSLCNKEHLLRLFNEMTIQEKQEINTKTFSELWKDMWNGSSARGNLQKHEELVSEDKFNVLKKGTTAEDEPMSLSSLQSNSTTMWQDQEWEFPKGRRNTDERDLTCAKREFEEETGIKKESLNLINNVHYLEEGFIGTNHKAYKNKYFISYVDADEVILTNYQVSEVSSIEWKTLEECLLCIRPYNLEKKELIQKVYNILNNYTLYK